MHETDEQVCDSLAEALGDGAVEVALGVQFPLVQPADCSLGELKELHRQGEL